MKIVKVKSSLDDNVPDDVLKCLNEVATNESGRNLVYEIQDKEGDIFISENHSVLIDSFKDFSKSFKNPGLIIFDAHPNCLSSDQIKFLVKENILKARNVVLVGIRNTTLAELKFIADNKIKVYTMKEIFLEKEEMCDGIMEQSRDWDGLYFSLNLDVLDPAFVPGIKCSEPGGMSTRELLYFIQRLKLLKNLKRVDITGVSSDKNTCKVAAKLISEFL